MKKIKYLILLAGFIFISCATTPKVEEQKPVFEIGQTGPGGGIVFYDAGSYEKGWRYFEAELHSEYEWAWGTDKYYLTAKEGKIGSGAPNTIRMLNGTKGNYSAADGCSNFKHGNGLYDGWFLPSPDELKALYEYLITTDYEPKYDAYWTSTEVSTKEAYYVNIKGEVIIGEKSQMHGIFPIRAF